MSKIERTVSRQHIQAGNTAGQHIEHREIVNDDLLPSAEEIAKLHAVDPEIMHWLKARAEKEQDFRHTAYKTRNDIIGKNESAKRRINVLGLILGFLVLITGMVFSYFLLINGHSITSTIFGGGTLVFGVSLFVNRDKGKEEDKAPKK